MTVSPDRLSNAIHSYRAEHAVSEAFSECLARLQAQGFSLIRDRAALSEEVRRDAAAFIIHYIALALDDHHLSEREMGNIAALKSIYNINEGDLLGLQRHDITDLLRLEMTRILADERVTDPEVMHQSDLQRALDLGYDEYLHLTRDCMRPIVDEILAEARGRDQQQQDRVFRRLLALQTVLRVDRKTMKAIWSD